jgi:hypothetical protein
MKRIFFVLLLLVMPIVALAQRSVSEYTPAQRAALQSFISRNPSYQFIPETRFDAETLSAARNQWGFGRNFKPYYQTGDFNRDGRGDFAVILLSGRNVDDPNRGLHVVVFNGVQGNTYRVAHIEREEFSTALFINTRRNRLHVGIMETDSVGCFVPAGRGYIVEPCGD